MSVVTVYGIKNCNSMKKAFDWLTAHAIDYTFVDYKKTPPTPTLLAEFSQQLSIDTLLNKQGTTWKKLPPEEQATATDLNGAIALLAAYPSMIKRPVITANNTMLCGFNEAQLSDFFAKDL